MTNNNLSGVNASLNNAAALNGDSRSVRDSSQPNSLPAGKQAEEDKRGSIFESEEDSVQLSATAVAIEEPKESEEEQQVIVNSVDLKEKTEERFAKLADEVNKKLESTLKVRFGQDEDTGIDYFQLYERKSGDVVRQFPTEELIDAIERTRDVTSLFVSEQA